MAKLSKTQQWMKDHPDDKPCPNDPDSAKAWRFKRGIGCGAATNRALWEKYSAAMAEKRCAREG
jgi:hypothetical protein